MLPCKDTNINIVCKLFDINFNIIFPVAEGCWYEAVSYSVLTDTGGEPYNGLNKTF